MFVRQLSILPALLLAWPAVASAGPLVRVRVAEQVQSVRLSGEGLRIQDQPVADAEVRATAAAGEIRVAQLKSRSPVRVQARRGLALDGRRFPGELSLVPRADATLDVVNLVPLEAYVERAVAGEVYASWPEEALKAQAVVTRTYVLYERERRRGEAFDVEASVISQRYAAKPAPEAVRQAAALTRGEFLAYRGQPILAAYHASAGGRTASSREVWGDSLPYLRSLSSPDAGAPDHFWSFEIPLADLRVALGQVGLSLGGSHEVRVLERSESGRVRELGVGDARLSGRELRKALGGRAIRSALFEVRTLDGQVRFLGSGAGHGVGLSQWGALELARRGKSYREILAHYYPGTTRRRLDGVAAADATHLSALP